MAAIRNALIVGGGIGGLTAAVALRRAGIDVDVVEIKNDWSVYGVGIIQPNNTLRAMDRIGLARACAERGGAFPGWRIYDEANRFLMDAPAPSTAAPQFPAINGITRPILQQILMEAALAAGMRAQLGTTVTAVQDSGSSVRVSCSNGTVADYDLLIAADGIHSATRTRLFGDAVVPRFTGQCVWRYNFERPADVEWGEIYFGSGTKVGLVPMSPATMYMFVVTAEPNNPRRDPQDLADLLRDRLADYTGRVAGLREKIVDSAAVVYKPMESVLLPKPWYKGRQIIIGDAAHATTPHLAQGAAMAIEDAVLLGDLLGRDRPLDSVLAEFVARRFDRSKYVIDTSDQLAAWELEQWNGVANPNANPGGLLHDATVKLMEDF